MVYRIAETDAQISKRLNEWDKFLETDEAKKEAGKASETKSKAIDSEKQEPKKDIVDEENTS